MNLGMRLREIGLLILLAAALVVPPPVARAAPTTYFVNFTGGQTLPALGVFGYDAASGFSNFLVSWNDTLFDLTGAANAPIVGGACPATSSPATGFALMSHSLCSDVFYRWIGNQSLGSSSFSFYNETLALPAHTGAFITATGDAPDPFGFAIASGDWTITNLTEVTGPAVSEPPTILVLLAGLFVLAGWRIRHALPSALVPA